MILEDTRLDEELREKVAVSWGYSFGDPES